MSVQEAGKSPVFTRMRKERTKTAWLFMAPMLVVLAAVAGWPLLRTIW
ncbi:MAG: sugar ABC transporter permease, partial [Planctomycetes bacterium]|nr:sugar ABC transporter permease [Planctomycetota bacterium]